MTARSVLASGDAIGLDVDRVPPSRSVADASTVRTFTRTTPKREAGGRLEVFARDPFYELLAAATLPSIERLADEIARGRRWR